MSYYYGGAVRCGFAELFGLSIKDLTDEQLIKINKDKLFEFIAIDPRAEKIAADELVSCSLDDFNKFNNIKEEDLPKIPYWFAKYNETIRNRQQEIDRKISSNYYNSRNNYIYWHLLDEKNKDTELLRWKKEEKNVIDLEKLDYSWLHLKYPDIEIKIVDKLLYEIKEKTYCSSWTKVVIGLLCPETLISNIEAIFKCGHSVFIHALGNPATPEKYSVIALRAIAGKRKNIPQISIPLSKKLFSQIPTMTRLKLFETLLYYNCNPGNLNFEDIKTSEDLNNFLFGTAIKSTERTQRVVGRFKQYYEKVIV